MLCCAALHVGLCMPSMPGALPDVCCMYLHADAWLARLLAPHSQVETAGLGSLPWHASRLTRFLCIYPSGTAPWPVSRCLPYNNCLNGSPVTHGPQAALSLLYISETSSLPIALGDQLSAIPTSLSPAGSLTQLSILPVIQGTAPLRTGIHIQNTHITSSPSLQVPSSQLYSH
jgi:hypothetical protein